MSVLFITRHPIQRMMTAYRIWWSGRLFVDLMFSLCVNFFLDQFYGAINYLLHEHDLVFQFTCQFALHHEPSTNINRQIKILTLIYAVFDNIVKFMKAMMFSSYVCGPPRYAWCLKTSDWCGGHELRKTMQCIQYYGELYRTTLRWWTVFYLNYPVWKKSWYVMQYQLVLYWRSYRLQVLARPGVTRECTGCIVVGDWGCVRPLISERHAGKRQIMTGRVCVLSWSRCLTRYFTFIVILCGYLWVKLEGISPRELKLVKRFMSILRSHVLFGQLNIIGWVYGVP